MRFALDPLGGGRAWSGLAAIARRFPGGKGLEHAAPNGPGPDLRDPGHAAGPTRGAVLRTGPARGRPGRARGEGEKRRAGAPEHTPRSRRPARSRVGLVLVSLFALLMAGSLAAPTRAQDAVEVPRSWPLKPSGVNVGDEFRLLFATSRTRNASSTNIDRYNSFVQGRAAVGHAAIRPTSISSGFKVVGSTSAVAARDNTATTYTSNEPGVQIWWLNGGKVADDYRDFYDGSWDTKHSTAGRNEWGGRFPGNRRIWSGSNTNGTASASPLGASSVGIFQMQYSGTLYVAGQAYTSSGSNSLLGLSPVLRVSDSVREFGISIRSSPANRAHGYNAGETIRLRVDFGEPVRVAGAPYLVLDVGGTARRAAYESGSGTRYLVFAYRVARDDTDTNGVSLCSDTSKDAGCGQIALNGGSIFAESDFKAVELELHSLGDQSGHRVDGVAEVKGVSITSAPADAARGYGAGETIRIQMDFAEPVTVEGSPHLVLDMGGEALRLAYESGSGTRYLVFTYRVARDEIDTNGVSLCSDTSKDAGCGQITLNGGSIVAESDSAKVEQLGLPSITKRLANHARPNDVTQGYAADWTIIQLREPVQKIADRIQALIREAQARSSRRCHTLQADHSFAILMYAHGSWGVRYIRSAYLSCQPRRESRSPVD